MDEYSSVAPLPRSVLSLDSGPEVSMKLRIVLSTSLVLFGATVPAAAQNWFATPRLFDETNLGRIYIAQDMDSDGDTDLVWIRSSGLRLWRNNGSGAFVPAPFSASPESLGFDSAHNPWPVAGDLTGDGLSDVVIAQELPDPDFRLLVFVQQADGTFGTVHTLVLAGWPRGLAVGNIDGDPALELGDVHEDDSTGNPQEAYASWWDFDGATFHQSTPLVLTGNVARPWGAAALDIDGNGVADLAISAGDGFRGPSHVQLLPTVAGAPTAGALHAAANLFELVAGDLDGDGDDDLYGSGRTTCTSNIVRVLENAGGSFSVVSSALIPIDELFCSWWPDPVLGDWDGDGDLDAFESYERANLYLNDGSNRFSLATAVAIESVAGFYGSSAGTADLDGDGNLDLIGPRAILYGDGSPPVAPEPPFPISFSTPVLVAADQDGVGDDDLVTINGELYSNDSTGAFQFEQALPFDGPGGGLYRSVVAVGNFDGAFGNDLVVELFDGDIFGPFLEMRIFVDDGSGAFVDVGPAAPPGVTIPFASNGAMRRGLDLDGDNDADIFAPQGYWENDGAGSFTEVILFPGVDEVVDAADVDGNGELDFLTLRTVGSNEVYDIQWQSSGVFTTQQLRSYADFEPAGRFLDLDNDLDLDVGLPGGTGTTALFVIENVGGVLGTAQPLTSAFGATEAFTATDVDGDFLDDVLLLRNAGGVLHVNIEVWRRSGPGLAYQGKRQWLGDRFRAFSDIDLDGDVDIVGDVVFENLREDGPSAGSLRQYGPSSPGAGGVLPVLGSAGPIQFGSPALPLSVRRAPGGSVTFLVYSLSAGLFPNIPFPGLTLNIVPPGKVFETELNVGPGGVPGAGGFDVFLSWSVDLIGRTVYAQGLILEPGGSPRWSATNGLELLFGE